VTAHSPDDVRAAFLVAARAFLTDAMDEAGGLAMQAEEAEEALGGPDTGRATRRLRGVLRGCCMTTAKEKSVAAEVLALQNLSVGDLRTRYADLFGETTTSRNKPWLFRACAWRVQELAFGGLSERAKQRAKELARESDVRPRGKRADAVMQAATGGGERVVAFRPAPVSNAPPPGTVLTRTYKGQEIRVRVMERGFEYDGQPYRSLSAVAKAVTGSHWNGRAFFGLKKGSA